MTRDGLLTHLCERWEESRRAGSSLTPEQLCRDHPELLDEVRRAVAALSAADRALADTSTDAVTVPDADDLAPAPPGFDLLSELGRGGMGVVYRARDRRLGRDVAVKVLRKQYPPRSSVGRRFVEEARVTGRLQHPGIPAVHQVGTLPDGRPYLAMRLIAGDTLADRLAARPDSGHELGRLVAAFEAVCQAVGYAHAQGVIHRDLKPQNVMVGAFGEVQVMDWGLARETRKSEVGTRNEDIGSAFPLPTSELTQAGDVMGTPAFMAPEQARGETARVGPRSDVFGLGGILLVILTGAPPFAGGTGEQARRRAAAGELADAFARLDGCGAEPQLVALCKRCLSAEPADRPPDGEAVARAVADFRADAERRARDAELARQRLAVEAREQRKRRRVQVGLAAAVAALVVGGGAVAWWADAEAGHRRTLTQSRDDIAAEQAKTAAALGREGLARGEAETARDRVARLEYARRMSLASRELLARNYAAVNRLLDDCPPELRGWEWHYARRAANPFSRTLTGHVGRVTSCTFSPDGRRLVTTGEDGTSRVWDPATGQELKVLRERADFVVFSPDSSTFVAISDDDPPRVFDGLTGAKLRELPDLKTVAFSPCGKYLVAHGLLGRKWLVRVLDYATGKTLQTLDEVRGDYDAFAFSSDSGRVAGLTRGKCRVWDRATGKLVAEVDALPPRPVAKAPKNRPDPLAKLDDKFNDLMRGVDTVAFTPDGNGLVTKVGVWELPGGKPLARFPLPPGAEFGDYAVSPTGTHAVTPEKSAWLTHWTLGPQAAPRRSLLPVRGVKNLRFVGDHFLLGELDEGSGERFPDCGVFDAGTADLVEVVRMPHRASCAALAPDGCRFAVGDDSGAVGVVDFRPGQRSIPSPHLTFDDRGVRTFNDWRIGPGANRVVSLAGNELTTLESPSGRTLAAVQLPNSPAGRPRLSRFSPTGRHVVILVGERGGEVEFRETDSGKLVGRVPHVGGPEPLVAYSADGEWVATVEGGRVSVRSAADLTPAREWDALRRPGRFALTAKGERLVVAGQDGSLRTWNRATGKADIDVVGTARCEAAVVSPDGGLVAFVEAGQYRVADTATGATRYTIPREAAGRRRAGVPAPVKFIDNGKYLCLLETGAVFHDAATGRPAFRLTGEASTDALMFVGGTRLLTVGGSGATVWDTATLEPVFQLGDIGGTLGPSTGRVRFDPAGRLVAVGEYRVEVYDGTPLVAGPTRRPPE